MELICNNNLIGYLPQTTVYVSLSLIPVVKDAESSFIGFIHNFYVETGTNFYESYLYRGAVLHVSPVGKIEHIILR